MGIQKLAFAILMLAACGPKPQDEPAATSDTATADTQPTAPEADTGDSSVISFGGIRGFVPGMSLSDAKVSIPDLEAPAAPAEGCDYASVGKGDDKLTFLIVDDKLARVDVASAAYATDRGIGIGDSEDQVKAAYPNVIVQPHKYTEGSYLIAANPADTTVALIFETDGSMVTQYRLGTQPVVGFVEGCS